MLNMRTSKLENMAHRRKEGRKEGRKGGREGGRQGEDWEKFRSGLAWRD
jgi:hypothetical protein